MRGLNSSFVFTLQLLFISFVVCQSDEYRIINTPNGLIRGRVLQTRANGTRFLAFQGIKYGFANRFEPAQPWHWQDTFNAINDGPACPQARTIYTSVSEDCLHLSVYVREDVFDSGSKVPVLVYIHGGAFASGSSLFEKDAGPQYFLEHSDSVVFVAINYRLNIFGFISTGSVAGNLGLKDQVLALKWIKRNIVAFGGSEVVTLLGASAGSLSASLHMVSPMSRDLFQRVILMSASAVSQQKIPRNLTRRVYQVGQKVGCAGDDHIVTCLKGIPMQELVTASMIYDWHGCPSLIWSPVIEEDFGQERFLAEDPIMRIKSVVYDVMAGYTKDEWVAGPIKFLKNPELFTELNENFTELAPLCFSYDTSPNADVASAKLRAASFGDSDISADTISGLHNLFSEGIIKFGMYRTTKLLTQSRVFAYRYSYQGRYCHSYHPPGVCYGVGHGDDVYHYLVQKRAFPQLTPADPEWSFVQKFTRRLIQFVKHGHPNGDNLEVWPEFWPTAEYMDLNEKDTVQQDFDNERFQLWDEIFPLEDIQPEGMGMTWWFWLAVLIVGSLIIAIFFVVKKFLRREYLKGKR